MRYGCLPHSSALPFIESVRKDQASALSEGLPKRRQPVDGFRPRIEEHAPGTTLGSGGNPPEDRLDPARFRVQNDRQTMAWTCVVDRLVRFGEFGSEVSAERFWVFRDRVATAHASHSIKTKDHQLSFRGKDSRQSVVTRPIFCTNPMERVYITAWGCEIGSGGRNGLQAPGAGGL